MLKRILLLVAALLLLCGTLLAQTAGGKTRLAIIGLDHDHVWGLMKTVTNEPDAELVAIADSHPELIDKAKAQAPAGVKFFSDYVPMLDEVKPEAVIVTTANNLHLPVLRECAKRKIHYFTEKPLAATAADARQMERLARAAGIKLMVNYWNVWARSSQDVYERVKSGELGPVQKIIVQYGHQGPKEIGTSKYFADWLYDPVKNGGGALVDFGCYGANWALWLKGRPTRVFAVAQKYKTEQRNAVDDEALIVLEYPDSTAVIQASWNWPYGKGQVEVFGPKGSLLARADGLFFQPAPKSTTLEYPDGQPVATRALRPEMRNGVAYFLHCIRADKSIEGPVSAELNVAVNEILDAAKESIRTGRAATLKTR